MASAMGGLLSLYALGSVTGPLVGSWVMSNAGADALFSFLAAGQGLLLLYVFYRIHVREALPNENQESYVLQQPTVAAALYELDPRTHYELSETPASLEAQVAIYMAESSPATAVNMAKEISLKSPEKAAELCSALAQVEKIDVSQLFRSITRAAPERSLEIAELLASNAPEESTKWVSWLAEHHPEQLADMIAELVEHFPLHEVAEPDMNRPADIQAYHDSATELVSHFAENQPEQAVEVAAAVIETLPDAASDIVDILHEAEQVNEQQLISELETEKK